VCWWHGIFIPVLGLFMANFLFTLVWKIHQVGYAQLWRVCPGLPSSVVAIVRKKTSQKHAPSPDLLFDMHLSSHELLHTLWFQVSKGLLELNLHNKLSHYLVWVFTY
jgi:hypothetical protein